MKATASDIQAIDAHGHYGRYLVDSKSERACQFQSADAAEVVRRARAANTEITIVSPLSGLLPRGRADAVAANDEAARLVEQTPELLQWVIVHPLQTATFDQARRRLAGPRCVGIKIHPEEHEYPITEYGPALFRFAAEVGAVMLAHSGDPYSLPADFVPLANAFPDVRTILAHLGNGGQAAGEPDLQVRAIQAAKHRNLWTDTSSARSILPGLIEWAVAEVGPERILYGTDTPLYFPPNQRARIDCAGIPDDAKQLILRDNVVGLLGLATADTPSRSR